MSDDRVSCVKAYIDAYNRFDVEAMLALMHPDALFANVSNGQVTAEADGIEQLRGLAELSKSAFSARRQTATNISRAGDVVTVDIDYEGTLAVDLPGGPKAGETAPRAARSSPSRTAGS